MKKKSAAHLLRKELKVYRQRAKRKIYLRFKNLKRNLPKYKTTKHKRKRWKTRFTPPATLHLPQNFSFINNPNNVLKTFAKFREHASSGRNVILDFRSVEIITPDVIPLLLAKVSKYQRSIKISGTRPAKQELDKLLLESGFYKIVGLTNYKTDRGLLGTHKSKIVDTEIAVDARKLTAEKTFGDRNRKIQPLYRTLIECMANTHKHASDQAFIESWWLSVYNDPVTKITSFAFCDTGVGIFKSTKLENFVKFAYNLGLKDNGDILKMILEGKITSSTGLHHRGKGLPKIYSDYKANHLRRLHIAANDTFADFDSGTFIELTDELNGTFLYWEIIPN